ncbi:DUF4097 family beta strand repeat-containing protein [Kribbella solani]|uniref:DUF4097 family beta strand repeat-containing protein n=1 Tax=Kribbella solani TaxID=236067 RepID=UPI0029A93661|nr:DUF4097 family beta strand repeat-containing protein [Kribbella solani]MDX2968189.1 DUF4097 family beta strand repeat-containing protein [Kribbella solani]MDX3003920.1 DUF4097 family beta strand repeat-containing protein [Kribbella solani]
MSGFSTQINDNEGDRIERVRIEIGSGQIEIVGNPEGTGTAAAIEVDSGPEEDVIVEVVDGELIVEGPRNVRRGPEIQVRIATSEVLAARIKTGSGDIVGDVPLGPARLHTGSGEVRLDRIEGDLGVNTGSGDVRVGHVAGVARVTTGSGSVEVEEAGDALGLSTGSGDVKVGDAAGPTTIKVGSGDITVERIRDHSVATSGSGDVKVELADAPSVQAETARGDVQIGVPDGLPTYLDLKTVTGRIRCDLQPGQQPAEGERALMLRARTVSGDITVVKV